LQNAELPDSPAPPLPGLELDDPPLVEVPAPPDAPAPPEDVPPDPEVDEPDPADEPEPEPPVEEPDDTEPEEPDEPEDPEAPLPEAPDEPAPEVPDEPLEAGDADELDPAPGVVVVEVVVVEEAAALAALEVGTVSCGAPDVSLADPPPPQAERPPARARPEPTHARVLRTRELLRIDRLGPERRHPAAAVGAVVEVLLDQLIAPIAEAQVLDRPRQLGGRRSQGKELTEDLQRLARLAIDIFSPRLGLDHDLSACRGRPHAVALTDPHAAVC